MTNQNYNVYEGLTSVRLVSMVNVSGIYNNGPVNNGVDSFIKIPSGSLVIDLKTVEIGDTVLLAGQTNANENGIYVCTQTGINFIYSILVRRNDFHCIEQIRPGQYISVTEGAINSGSIFSFVSPLPIKFGIDPIIINGSQSSLKNVTIDSTDLSSIGNSSDFVLFADYTGTITENLQSAPIDVIGDSNTVIVENGITSGTLFTQQNKLILNGIIDHTTDIQAASNCILDVTNASVVQAPLAVQILSITQNLDESDNDNMSVQILETLNTDPLGKIQTINGDANYLFDCKSPTSISYFNSAGTAAGSAGDPTHCNANSILKIRVSGVDKYIPLFDSNA